MLHRLALTEGRQDGLTPVVDRLESMGTTANFVLRPGATQNVLRRSMQRVYQIERFEFVPSRRAYAVRR